MIYLDNSATTPLCPEAKTAMCAAMEKFGNPSSVHAAGIDAAALLRESDMNLEAIATACGFANGSYFSTVFKNSFRITPLKYRRDNVLKYPDLTDILQ